ncbi:Enolase [Vibrio nigripulchritudo SO65]|uniref:phosphopyruvate hydratase n=1 Tax=Vibrio nigripulchritudo TaxID=28173 RepID=UPI0003B20CA7|nr:phosphopyruvate hydratase [Vibrio nigripulchritudo]CCN38457.1 Enolase [Vibrio nigripulchritudo AM115]CCN44253.1 Enolase [Vibrio nigripulchritudo FTn2]CCN67737.1 Enolase [Vibrio nigripulchritudo POn4]CCN76012.1 Enolase [Vibrio nigripulchritudo SO65]
MKADNIRQVRGRRVWDSRGAPTVEVEVELESGATGRAIAPAGASRGMREAVDLRDGGSVLKGLDVQNALNSVQSHIAPALTGKNVFEQNSIDQTLIDLDGTGNMAKLGGNATIATSLAVIHAAAAQSQRPLWKHLSETYKTKPSIPLPEIQIFGGGAHAGRRVDIQDFMVMVPGANSFSEALEVTAEIYHAAGKILADKGKLQGVADEGGWWPAFDSNEEALETLVQAIEKAGQKPGDNVIISLDIAASEFYSNGQYQLALEDRSLNRDEMIGLLEDWVKKYPIASIEDPLAEDDKQGMVEFTRRFGKQLQIIGDDYLVTNPTLVKQAIADKACNAVLVKVNQIGTVSQAIETCQIALQSGWRPVVSARSGETEDLSIVDLSVGLGAGQLKVGSFSRSERMAKWNECLRIEEQLAGSASGFVRGMPLANTWWGEGKK